MGVIEEDPLRIQSESTPKRNSRDMENAHDQEEEAKKKIIKKSEILMSLTDLPSDVLVDILARLPIRTLFVARSVCKTFVFLTTDNPDFINLHSSKATQILVFQFRPSDTVSSLLRMADYELDCKNFQLKTPLFQLPKVNQYTYSLVNSCNGLLLFQQNGYGRDYSCLVCNPVTSEYIKIPYVVPVPKIRLCLGFSPGTNQYKVLIMFQRMNGAQVYVIGSDNSWRDVGDTLMWASPIVSLGRAQLVNGLVYWHYRSWPVVISFDFESEKFGKVSLPPEVQEHRFISGVHYTSIGVLGGCLCLSWNDSYAHRLDLWVMTKCGNQESWTKDFVIDTVTLRLRGQPVYYGQFKLLQFLGNGEILMLWMSNNLVCYDPRTNNIRYFEFDRDDLGHKVVALTPSFVPLKDELKVDKVLTQLRPRVDEMEL